jgi:hypothetical protein
MKCPKCGYISFDYLSNCKRCHTDLGSVRQILGVLAVGVGTPGVLLQSTALGGVSNALGEFLFSESSDSGEAAFKFEEAMDEKMPPVAEMKGVSDQVAKMEESVLDLIGDTGDLEEIHLDLSGTQEELSFEPGLDAEAIDEGTEGLDLELDITTAESSIVASQVIDQRELELTTEPEIGSTEAAESPAPPEEPVRTLDVSELEEGLPWLAEEPMAVTPEVQEGPVLSLSEEAAEELSPQVEGEVKKPEVAEVFGDEEAEGMLQVSDLEEEFSGLIGEPVVATPETREESIFDVSDEKLEDLPLILEGEVQDPAEAGTPSHEEAVKSEKAGGVLDFPDLEEELSALVDETLSVASQDQGESIIDLSDETLTDQSLADLSLEELGKDEIFQGLESEGGGASLDAAPGDTSGEDLSIVDLDLDAEMAADLDELTRDVEQSLKQLAEEAEVSMSDKEILASIPDETKR